MRRFYLDAEHWTLSEPALDAEESHHLAKVLRAQPGEAVEVFDGTGRLAHARVLAVGKRCVTLTLDTIDVPTPLPLNITLFQAIPKGPRMDWLVEKATEIGVARLVPLVTERCEVRCKKEDGGGDPRLDRWRRIALSAAKQCGILRIPSLGKVQKPGDWATLFAGCDIVLMGVLDPQAPALGHILKHLDRKPIMHIGILIGPEGDLTPGEIAGAQKVGAVPVSFGPHTLRVETAALFALSVITDAYNR